MTIFLEIVKEFLGREITKVRDTSIEADVSVTNRLSSWVGYGRDIELSEKKRQAATDLLYEFRKMGDESNDLVSCNHLKVLIEYCKNLAKDAGGAKGYDEGTFGPAMLSAGQLTQDLYAKLGKFKLLGIPHDDDPFNEFRYRMAYYYAQKLDDSRTPSILNNPKITSSNEITHRKEQLVFKILTECEKDLQTLDIEHVDYISTRKNRVLEWIEKLSRENIALCKEYTSELAVPISLSFFSKVNVNVPSIGPDEGFLEYCLQACIAQINAKCVVEEKEQALVF